MTNFFEFVDRVVTFSNMLLIIPCETIEGYLIWQPTNFKSYIKLSRKVSEIRPPVLKMAQLQIQTIIEITNNNGN